MQRQRKTDRQTDRQYRDREIKRYGERETETGRQRKGDKETKRDR